MNKRPDITDATRAGIIEAFWSLSSYKEKDTGKLSVSRIAEKAGIHRSTFYQYFSSMEDLADEAGDDLIDEMAEDMDKLPFDQMNGLENISRYTLPVFMKHSEHLLCMLMSDSKVFEGKMIARIRPYMLRILRREEISDLEYLTVFELSGILGILRYWNSQGRRIPIGELMKKMQCLIGSGVLGYTERFQD